MRTLESFFQEAKAEQRMETPALDVEPPSSHEGLVIQEIEMKGFMRYLRATTPITFPEKFTAITGPTGAGKTSILDAITFALYKRSTRTDLQAVRISDVCEPGGYVRMGFRQGGSKYDVKRGFTTKGSPYLELQKDGKPLRGTIPELELLIEDIVGLDYEGFRNSTFVRQEEMKQLGAESSAQRLEVFQKLFRLETFEKAAEVAKGKLDDVHAHIAGVDGELSVLRGQVQSLPARKDEASSLEGRVKELRGALTTAEAKQEVAERSVRSLEQSHEAYIRSVTLAERLRQEMGKLEGQLQDKREVLTRKAELKTRSEELSLEVKKLRKSQKRAQKLSETARQHAVVAKELESLQDRLGDLETAQQAAVRDFEEKIEEEEGRLRGLDATMGADDAFDILREEGALTERLQRIEKELDWLAEKVDIIRQLKAEEEESRKRLGSVREVAGEVNRDVFLYSEIAERIEGLKAELASKQEEWNARKADLEIRRKELEDQLKSTGFGPEEEAELKGLQEGIEKLPAMEETLLSAREDMQRLIDLEEQIQDGESRLEEMQKSIREANETIAEAENQEAAFQKAKEALERRRRERDDAAKALYKLEGALKAATDRVRELEELSKRLKESESRAAELRAKAEVYSILRDGVFHRKGVVMYAINRLLPALEIEASRNLDDLTNGRLHRVKLDTHEEAQRYGIRILVEGVDGEWHDVAIFSGGERTQINAALRFAIAKELASMPQVGRTYGRMKTLFIDEGDLGSLDTESSRELFVAKLFKMGEFFDKVILITHLGEVAERFPGRVRVSMTAEGESRAEVVP